MNKTLIIVSAILFSWMSALAEDTPAVSSLLHQYRTQGAAKADPIAGERLWHQGSFQPDLGRTISCTSCHGVDLGKDGKHIRTGKVIKPMAPSTNPERLQDTKKIEKWFRRNCKLVFARECSPQEKADILGYLLQQ